MYRRILLFITLISSLTASSQFRLSGVVSDEVGETLIGAIIKVEDSFRVTFTDDKGQYELRDLPTGSYGIEVTYIGYKTELFRVEVGSQEVIRDVVLKEQAVSGPEVVVSAYRATHRDPIAYSELQKADLLKSNLGMDVPELLNTLPSITFSSDAGNGIGYTYMRLRGSDQTNINVTINGVPINDSESHGVFWVNLPDIVASADNVQVQRGVGTSSNGAGAFGGSVNLLTQSVRKEAFGNVDIGAGSFNTQKYSVGFGTGLLNSFWSLEGRLSKISSDGYIDRSSADLKSYFLSGGFQRPNTSLKLLLFGGREVTQQAWWGVPRARLEDDEEGMIAFAGDNGWSDANLQNLLDSDRRFNFYRYDNEVDEYGQDHAQLHFSQKLDHRWRLNASAHYTKGEGYFEQFQDKENAYDDTDLSYYGIAYPVIGEDTIRTSDIIRRRWLDNDFYGAIASIQYTQGPWQTVIGAGWNHYDGGHFGEVIWASNAGNSQIRERYYENDAVKEEMNAYVKTNYRIAKNWDAFVDLQGRTIDYSFIGPRTDGELTDQTVSYQFFNPKGGLTYTPNDQHRAFASYGIAHKEPNRDDHVISTANSRPRAQQLADLELGYSYRSKKVATEVTLYHMQYSDQLINTGEINDVGENVRTNVADSYRRGVEWILTARPTKALLWNLNLAYSQNVIQDHVEYVSDYLDYSLVEQALGDVTIAYSPSWIASSTIRYRLMDRTVRGKGPDLDLNLISKYVGEQYLDNTETKGRTIDAYMTHDLRLDLSLAPRTLKTLKLTFLVRNVLDEMYSANGWTYRYLYAGEETSFDALFPQAGINFMTGLSVNF